MQGTRKKHLPSTAALIYTAEYGMLCNCIETLFNDILEVMKSGDTEVIALLSRLCDEIKDTVLCLSSRAEPLARRRRNPDDGSLRIRHCTAVLFCYAYSLLDYRELS